MQWRGLLGGREENVAMPSLQIITSHFGRLRPRATGAEKKKKTHTHSGIHPTVSLSSFKLDLCFGNITAYQHIKFMLLCIRYFTTNISIKVFTGIYLLNFFLFLFIIVVQRLQMDGRRFCRARFN